MVTQRNTSIVLSGRLALADIPIPAAGVIAIVGSILLFTSVSWLGVCLLWLALLWHCVRAGGDHAPLAIYLGTFFVLLMTQRTINLLIGYDPGVPIEWNRHLDRVLAVALIGLGIGHRIIGLDHRNRQSSDAAGRQRNYLEYVRVSARTVFLIAFGASVLLAAVQILFVLRMGYASLYGAYIHTRDTNLVLRVASRTSLMLWPSLAVYLATFPPRSQCARILAAAVGASLLLSMTGARKSIILMVLGIITYWFVRVHMNDGKEWRLGKRGVVLLSVSGISLLALAGLAETIRGIVNASNGPVSDIPLIGTLYGQGVTASVIINAARYSYLLPAQMYSSYFLHASALGALLGFDTYSGVSIDRAFHGSSLMDSLSYVYSPDWYLSGYGAGGAAFADMYYDFGYLGVFVYSVVIGVILTYIGRPQFSSVWVNASLWALLPSIWWSLRSAATDPLATLFSFPTFGCFLIIWVLASLKVVHDRSRRLSSRLNLQRQQSKRV